MDRIWQGIRRLRGKSPRFKLLTPPFLARQCVYDSATGQLIRLRIRNAIDWYVVVQIFGNNDYGFEKLARAGELMDCYQRMLGAGRQPLIIDCGANSGMATRFFREIFPRSRIVAIEPDEGNLQLAKENNPAAESTATQFRLAGVSSADGRGVLVDPNAGNWAFQTVATADGPLQMISINAILDELAQDAVAPYIIKIDIEGFESDLFSRNTDWLVKFPVLIIELHDYLLPKSGSSKNFLSEIAKLDRDFILSGENIFSIAHALP
jgi:FkbM family methyltransferase